MLSQMLARPFRLGEFQGFRSVLFAENEIVLPLRIRGNFAEQSIFEFRCRQAGPGSRRHLSASDAGTPVRIDGPEIQHVQDRRAVATTRLNLGRKAQTGAAFEIVGGKRGRK